MNRLTIEVLWWATQHHVDWLVDLIYNRYCPYPARGHDYHLARDCVRLGHCGCNNQDRYSPKQPGAK